jgi:hypothetical protein
MENKIMIQSWSAKEIAEEVGCALNTLSANVNLDAYTGVPGLKGNGKRYTEEEKAAIINEFNNFNENKSIEIVEAKANKILSHLKPNEQSTLLREQLDDLTGADTARLAMEAIAMATRKLQEESEQKQLEATRLLEEQKVITGEFSKFSFKYLTKLVNKYAFDHNSDFRGAWNNLYDNVGIDNSMGNCSELIRDNIELTELAVKFMNSIGYK